MNLASLATIFRCSTISFPPVEGHDKVVQMLLNKGADINAQGGDYGNV